MIPAPLQHPEVLAFYLHISNEGAAIELFEEWRWLRGRFCPECGSSETAYYPSYSTPYRCVARDHLFSVRTGTRYDDKRPLWVWALQIYFERARQKGQTSEEAATKFFEVFRWGETPLCPRPGCGSAEVSTVITGEPMPYRCRKCRQHFSVLIGTVFEKRKLSLDKLLMAICSYYGSGGKVKYKDLAAELSITPKTAWKLMNV